MESVRRNYAPAAQPRATSGLPPSRLSVPRLDGYAARSLFFPRISFQTASPPAMHASFSRLMPSVSASDSQNASVTEFSA